MGCFGVKFLSARVTKIAFFASPQVSGHLVVQDTFHKTLISQGYFILTVFFCVIPLQSLFSTFTIFSSQNYHKQHWEIITLFLLLKDFFPLVIVTPIKAYFSLTPFIFSYLILLSAQLWRTASAMTYIITLEFNYFHHSLKVKEYYCSEFSVFIF